ncbi:hypothetical protein [Pseudonocardia sp. DLS-67]
MTSAAISGSARRRWPALAGIAFAVLVSLGAASGVDQAPVLAAAATLYIGSAALQKPGAAWPLFFGSVVVITAARLLGFDATLAVLGCGVALGLYGLLRGVVRPGHGLPLQTVALLGFGAFAAVALLVNPGPGAYLVAAGLLGHAAWDLHHYRTHRVVSRSLAEFCLALDALLAVLIVVMTLVSPA